MMLLHGEQEVSLTGPLPPSASLEVTPKFAGIYDKGKGALVVLDQLVRDASTGETVATGRSSVFIRGVGGFGGDR